MHIMTSGPTGRPLNRSILGFFYLYFFLHWGTGILMFREKLGFSAASVKRYFLGDPERFMNPRSFAGLLEVSHFHLFAMGLFFVVFTHLLLFTPLRRTLQAVMTWSLALALLSDMASGWLIRYLSPEFAWLKLGAFCSLQGLSLLLLAALAAGLGKRRDVGSDP